MISIKVEHLNPPLAAAYLGVSRDTIIRLCDTGQLPHTRIKIGSYVKRLIHCDDLEAFKGEHFREAVQKPKRRPGRPSLYKSPQ